MKAKSSDARGCDLVAVHVCLTDGRIAIQVEVGLALSPIESVGEQLCGDLVVDHADQRNVRHVGRLAANMSQTTTT